MLKVQRPIFGGWCMNLRPPLLDELGLVVALRNYKLGDAGLRLEVNAPTSNAGFVGGG